MLNGFFGGSGAVKPVNSMAADTLSLPLHVMICFDYFCGGGGGIVAEGDDQVF